MIYLIAIVIALLFLSAFLALTRFERKRGTRFFSVQRKQLDAVVMRGEFIVTHVDLPAFVRDEVQALAHRVGHEGAHLMLQAVRTVERLLTRSVRHLRLRESARMEPRESSREFVKTLSDFKDQLKSSRPETPDSP